MDYQEFKRQLGKAGLTGVEFAELINVNKNSISNLAGRGDVPNHLAIIAVLLGEMAERRIDYRCILNTLHLKKRESSRVYISRM